MFSVGKGGGGVSEAGVEPQLTLTVPEWTWAYSSWQMAAQSLATLFSVQNNASGVRNDSGFA